VPNWRTIEGGEQTIIDDFVVRVMTDEQPHSAWRAVIKSRGVKLKFFDHGVVNGLQDKRIAKFVALALLDKLRDLERATRS
jgi:hypothetical protein